QRAPRVRRPLTGLPRLVARRGGGPSRLVADPQPPCSVHRRSRPVARGPSRPPATRRRPARPPRRRRGAGGDVGGRAARPLRDRGGGGPRGRGRPPTARRPGVGGATDPGAHRRPPASRLTASTLSRLSSTPVG